MNFYRKIVGIIAIVLMLGMTSCIDLLNELTINKDKSGIAFIGIKVNALAGLINMDSDLIDKDVKNSVILFPSQSEARLKGVSGISDIKTFTKISRGKLGIQFKFINQKALNNAYYALLGEDKKWYYPKMLKISNHKVKVHNVSPYIKRYFEQNESILSDGDLLKYLKFTTIIHTPNEIKANSFAKGKLSSDRKTLSYSISMKKILDDKESCGNKLKY
jgi:hypothetical protein